MDKPNFSVCETVAAIKPHLRVLTSTGKHLGGGADSNTLCGLKACWDTNIPVPKQGEPAEWLCARCDALRKGG